MKVLISGINGFLGKAITKEYLRRKDVEVFGISRTKGNLPVTYYYADVLEANKVESVFRQGSFDVVIHLAALTAHSQIVDNKFETLETNLNGTKNLLTAFNKYCSGGLFVYASTGKVYGSTNEMPISEKAITHPMNILGKSKLITERLIDFYVQPQNKYLIARIFNIFGGEQKDNFVVPTIINQLKKGHEVILGNTEDKRDYLYIKDFTNALISCVDNRDKFSQFEIVNIGSGIPVSVHDIVNAFEKSLGISICINTDANRFRTDETPIEFCDNRKLKQVSGWDMVYTLQTAIDELCREKGLK